MADRTLFAIHCSVLHHRVSILYTQHFSGSAFRFAGAFPTLCDPEMYRISLTFTYFYRTTNFQVRWLRFFREFWSYNVFIDLLLFAAFLAGIQILNNPRNSAADVEEKLKQTANDDDMDLGVD